MASKLPRDFSTGHRTFSYHAQPHLHEGLEDGGTGLPAVTREEEAALMQNAHPGLQKVVCGLKEERPLLSPLTPCLFRLKQERSLHDATGEGEHVLQPGSPAKVGF